jgi:ankyrin repeat protein
MASSKQQLCAAAGAAADAAAAKASIATSQEQDAVAARDVKSCVALLCANRSSSGNNSAAAGAAATSTSTKPNDAALLQACREGRDLATITLLLNANADANTREPSSSSSPHGWSPLHYTAWLRRPRIAALLVARKADVNAADARQQTPLMQAAKHGYFADMCVLLLEAGADVTLRNAKQHTAAHCAMRNNKSGTASQLQAWPARRARLLRNRAAAKAFARLQRRARKAHVHGHWTDSKLFDVNLLAEITAFVV